MISHKRKCVFIHIPKCAGQSIEEVFVNDAGLNWSNRAPLLLRKNENPEIGPPFLAHLTYRDYLKYWYASPEIMSNYYVFSVVRDPYTRVESIYRYRSYSSGMSFSRFVKKVVTRHNDPSSDLYYFFRPQVEYLVNDQDEIAVSNIFKLECMGDMLIALQRLGISISELPHKNKTKKPTLVKQLYRLMCVLRAGHLPNPIRAGTIEWDRGSLEVINRIYEKDFMSFGYTMR